MKNNTKQVNAKSNGAWFKIVLCLWCFVFILIFAKSSDASESSIRTFHALEGKVVDLTATENKEQVLKQTKLNTNNEVISRETHIANKQAKFNAAKSKLSISIDGKSMIHEFSIFEAFSQLFDDYDSDGFYQTFSVTFDADVETYGGHNDAYVYAEIYLSRNGGPWEYFYTTENFVIYGNSTEDAYEVMSNLDSGYPSDYYDVLIDLYEVGYSGIVASYSSDDSNSLYALALESDDFDQDDYYEYHVHGGSTALATLLLLFATIGYRRLVTRV